MEPHETFISLLCNPAHIELELFIIIVVDVLIGMILWPLIKKAFKHHKKDDDHIRILQDQVKILQGKVDELSRKVG
jgi:hypothetical protein